MVMCARSNGSLACRVVVIACLTLLVAVSATAQQNPAQAAPTENPVLSFFKNTELSGFVDTYYSYDFNTPRNPCLTTGGVAVFNCLHAFDVAHNSFSLSLAELALEKKPTADSRGGFRVDLNYGSTASIVACGEPGGASGIYQNVQQAYLSYLVTAGKSSLQFDFGKFVTPAGFEVIESKDNWNYSRGLLFQLAIPLYHQGLRVAYSPNDRMTFTGFVFNGWNNGVDNNGGKSIGFSVTAKPTASFSIAENYIGGPEISGNNSDWRHLSDTVLTYTPNRHVSLAFNYDWAREARPTPVDPNFGVQWQGIAAYVKYQPNAWFAFVPRYEYFKDRNGFATGIAQNVQDLTLTFELKHKDGALMRVEYRGDMSNTPYFFKNTSEVVKNQNALTVGWVYAFSSKTP